jgi:F-type H+-transporting ATPase subunit delta
MKQNSLFLARKYARAYDAAAKDGTQAASNFSAYKNALEALGAVADYMASPALPFGVKQDILSKVLPAGLAASFIKLLVFSKRFYLAPLIARELQNLLDARRGVKRIDISSAAALGEEQKQKIEAAMAEFFKGKIAAAYSIDESILAGFAARCGDFIIDASAFGRIKNLAKTLIGTGK